MNPTTFIEALRQRAVENNTDIHLKLLETTLEAKDPKWTGILPIYNRLSEDEKASFIDFLRLMAVNTLSIVLGVLDGSSYLNEDKEDFVLTTKSDNEKINGDLLHIFWQLEELENQQE